MDAGDSKKKQEKKKKESRFRWAVQVFFIAVVLSAALSFASDQALNGAGLAVAFTVLLAFILLGILFDIIGVAVTAADEKPFHSMAARRTPGAREALGLIRKADKVSSFCNDVVGDICGIISGSTGAVIVVQMQAAFGFLPAMVISLAVTVMPGSRLGITMRPFSSVMYSPLSGPTTAPLESVTRKVTPLRG